MRRLVQEPMPVHNFLRNLVCGGQVLQQYVGRFAEIISSLPETFDTHSLLLRIRVISRRNRRSCRPKPGAASIARLRFSRRPLQLTHRGLSRYRRPARVLQVSLERMLKIKAQSSSSGRRRFSKPSPSSSSPPSSSSIQTIATEATPHLASTTVDPTVLVTIKHSPLHVGCFFQASTTSTSGGGSSLDADQPLDSEGQRRRGCSAFSLASPACARVFPLRRCDWEGGGGGGAGAALFAAAAAVEGGGGGGGETRGHVSAEEVPRGDRLRYRYMMATIVLVLGRREGVCVCLSDACSA